jgi:membrane-associated protease RseP (regulator of RpoE activity)
MRTTIGPNGTRAFLLGTAMTMLLVAATNVVGTPVAAQEEPEDCRCVDRDGNEIEDCTCLRTPRITQVMPRAFALVGDSRPRLGISVDVTDEADDAVRGARVVDVLEGGPADEAGLQEGDVITHVDGRSLSEPLGAEAERDIDLDGSVPAQRLLALARDLEPGPSVEIAYVRDGRQRTTMVEARDLSDEWGRRSLVRSFDVQRLQDQLRSLGEGSRRWRFRADPGADVRVFGGRDADVHVFGDRDGTVFFGRSGLARGLELVELNPSLGTYFGAEEGVLVTDVGPSSTLGLEPGDVVLSVDGREVTTPSHLRRILASCAEDEEIELTVMRDGEEMTFTGPMR